MGGPLVNKLGVKWALVIGSASFPIQGSAYYCNSKFGNQWVSGKPFTACPLPKADIWNYPPKVQGPDKTPFLQYLIFSGAISGIGTGCWYVAEAGAIMTLAPSGARGKYLALWIVSRNLGQLVGGAIK